MTCRYCGEEYYDDGTDDNAAAEDDPAEPEADTRGVDVIALITLPLAVLALLGAIYLIATSTVLAIAVGAWFALFGTFGALIAPRKGIRPRDAFILSGIFGIFGIAYIALKEDV